MEPQPSAAAATPGCLKEEFLEIKYVLIVFEKLDI